MEKCSLSLMILFEEDRADRNVSAYLPELGLQTIGDNVEDALENALDSIHAMLENDHTLGQFSSLKRSFVQRIEAFAVLFEESSNGTYSAYVPALRLTVSGKNLSDAEENVQVLIGVELEELKSVSQSLPQVNAVFSTVEVNVPFLS